MWFPEVEPFSLNFMTAGYDTIYIVPALGLLYYSIVWLWMLIFAYYMLDLVASKYGGKVQKIRDRIGDKIFWNPIIRLYLESYL